ncbi:YvrJ family protein [Bacillus sp. SM2101]|uniref:YvrJ family protein n=1 Tax=Bacillus sp. SM2101 TaxID=2805366 RepID=UPI001BDF4248|nr:YvrJ family protein [Bacillus sp. SM2101]
MLEGVEFIPLIGNFGFPIALVVYLLIRFENKIESLEQSINNLAESMRRGG